MREEAQKKDLVFFHNAGSPMDMRTKYAFIIFFPDDRQGPLLHMSARNTLGHKSYFCLSKVVNLSALYWHTLKQSQVLCETLHPIDLASEIKYKI